MNRDVLTGRRTALYGAAALFLLPALLRAQTAPAKPPEKPQAVDMGTYKVSAPPGKHWQIETTKKESAVTFARYKERLLPGSDRVDMIGVRSEIVNIYGWRSTEEEVIADYLFHNGILAMRPRESWGTEAVAIVKIIQ